MNQPTYEEHTKGPWRVIVRGHSKGYCDIDSIYENTIVSNIGIGNANRIVEAVNAYEELKQQRDELLEALKGVIRVADRKTDEFDAAHAAIAKVTK